MRLVEHQIAAITLGAVEEVVEAHLEQVGSAGIAGNVTTQFAIGLIGAHDHGQGVPAHHRSQALLHGQITRKLRLLLHGDAVHIGRTQYRPPAHAGPLGNILEQIQHGANALRAVGLQQ